MQNIRKCIRIHYLLNKNKKYTNKFNNSSKTDLLKDVILLGVAVVVSAFVP